MKDAEYALYKGDELIGIGSISELAKIRGVSRECIRYLKTSAYKRKQQRRGNPWNTLALIPLEEEDDNA